MLVFIMLQELDSLGQHRTVLIQAAEVPEVHDGVPDITGDIRKFPITSKGAALASRAGRGATPDGRAGREPPGRPGLPRSGPGAGRSGDEPPSPARGTRADRTPFSVAASPLQTVATPLLSATYRRQKCT